MLNVERIARLDDGRLLVDVWEEGEEWPLPVIHDWDGQRFSLIRRSGFILRTALDEPEAVSRYIAALYPQATIIRIVSHDQLEDAELICMDEKLYLDMFGLPVWIRTVVRFTGSSGDVDMRFNRNIYPDYLEPEFEFLMYDFSNYRPEGRWVGAV